MGSGGGAPGYASNVGGNTRRSDGGGGLTAVIAQETSPFSGSSRHELTMRTGGC